MKSTELIEEIRQTENRSEIPYFDRTFDECEELVNEFENQSKWVDVNERLPETNCPVLVTKTNGTVVLMSYHAPFGSTKRVFNWWGFGNWIDQNKQVSAWMELPKPFKS